MQIVAPSRCNCRSRSITASLFFESRFPVGSSASRIEGWPTKRARDGDALLLTAGKLRGIMLHPMSHAHAFENFLHALFSLGRGHAAIGERQLDVFEDGEVANQIERLENEADLAIANASAVRERKIRHRVSIDPVIALGRRIEQAQNREQRGLAAARRAGDRKKFAVLDFEMDAASAWVSTSSV